MKFAQLMTLLAALACDPATFVEGTVTDENGRPVVGALVTLTCAEGGPRSVEASADSTGHVHQFTIGCVDDQCKLDISAPGYGSVSKPALAVCRERKWMCGCIDVDANTVLTSKQ